MFVFFQKGKLKTTNLIKDRKNKYGGTYTFGKTTVREKDGALGDRKQRLVEELGYRYNIWEYATGKGNTTSDAFAFEHPAMFPRRTMLMTIYLSWSNENDLVYDCFMGSGTTAKMSILNNRNWIGSELSNEYCNIIEEELKKRGKKKEKKKIYKQELYLETNVALAGNVWCYKIVLMFYSTCYLSGAVK